MSFVLPAFLLGLFGSAHCVMMCGGISGSLGGGLVRLRVRERPWQPTFTYNFGRIASYVALGALAGVLGRAIDSVPGLADARLVLRLCAGAVVVGAGLYIAGWRRFALIERLGAPVWRRVQPVAARFIGSPSTLAGLAVGALWGLLPCGLVYAAFGLALASGSASSGALVMAAFGLGTAPAMVATGLASARLAPHLHAGTWLRRAAGIVVLVFGLVDVVSASTGLAHPAQPTCCAGHH